GYHPVQIGDTFNRRYQVVSKLGWGYFSTVWLCVDLLGRRVAVKVLKSGAGFAQAGQDELTLLQCASGPVARHPSSQRIVQLLDEFKLAGVNGVMCLVLELLGPNLRSWQLCFGTPELFQPWVKQIVTQQVLQGLDYLHTQCKIIHTDIKPENILLCKEITVKIADLGSSCWVRSRPVSIAHWRFCWDLSMAHLLTSGVLPAWQAFELVTGDSLFEPKASESISLEEHIAQIMQLLGKIPPAVALSGKYSADYFSRRDLRRVGPLRLWSLYDVLVEKYHFLLEEASGFSDFLLGMLDYYPGRRATAAQCLRHPWL
uniref:non-specific serine/threonine protein kinase n=1 Tax=Acanthochromis polyacanthus TaxID=80966 RepID=A0A3Q1G6Z6_9TELE